MLIRVQLVKAAGNGDSERERKKRGVKHFHPNPIQIKFNKVYRADIHTR